MSPIKSTTRGRAIATLSRSSPVVVVVVVVVVVDRCDDTDTDTDTLVRDRDRCHPPTTHRRPTTTDDRQILRRAPINIHTVSFPASVVVDVRAVAHRRPRSSSSSSGTARHPSYIIIIIIIARAMAATSDGANDTHDEDGIDRCDRSTPSPPRIQFNARIASVDRRACAYLGGDGGARVLTRDARARAERDQTSGVQREDGGHGRRRVAIARRRGARACTCVSGVYG